MHTSVVSVYINFVLLAWSTSVSGAASNRRPRESSLHAEHRRSSNWGVVVVIGAAQFLTRHKCMSNPNTTKRQQDAAPWSLESLWPTYMFSPLSTTSSFLPILFKQTKPYTKLPFKMAIAQETTYRDDPNDRSDVSPESEEIPYTPASSFFKLPIKLLTIFISFFSATTFGLVIASYILLRVTEVTNTWHADDALRDLAICVRIFLTKPFSFDIVENFWRGFSLSWA